MIKLKNLGIIAVLALIVVFAAACGNSGSSNNNNGSGNTDSGNSDKASGSIVAGGSSALQPLAAVAAKQFMSNHPQAKIQIQGGGSGTGLTQVAQGNFDIGNSDIFAEELDSIDASALKDHKVAVVGMAPAVNKKAGVDNVSQEDLIKIFQGKITNWKEVGGKDLKIILVNRPDGSGTRATFVQFALNGKKPSDSGITQDSSNTVKQIIEKTPGAIGYEAFSYFSDDSDMVKLSIDGVKPTEENVLTNKYKVWAYEHMYTKGEAEGLEKKFINYMLSDEVQNGAVKKLGYIPATKMKVERDASGKVTQK